MWDKFGHCWWYCHDRAKENGDVNQPIHKPLRLVWVRVRLQLLMHALPLVQVVYCMALDHTS